MRPEYFKLVSEHDGVEAFVRERIFMAGVYALELSIADTNITIKTMQKHPQKGDRIFIALEKEAFEK